jgi:hypothetical protein
MEKKQTAVQWLSSHWAKLQKDGEKMTWQQIIDITNLALQMEKEQIINAWITTDNQRQRLAAEEYYNQTYNQNK